MENFNDVDQIKIKTLCDFLFFDQFQDTATFPRFEQCFQPLFNNIKNISMETVFKDICGPKKKYITYKRFAKAYLNHKNGKDNSEDIKLFFDKLLNWILKDDNSFIGKTNQNMYSFSTKKISKTRDCISMVQVLCDKFENILGINLEYDGVYQSKMYPQKLENELFIFLEMTLGIIDEKLVESAKKISLIDQGNYRDAVTHIFGTMNPERGLIKFLGFKCISGKTVFVGFPEGDGFLFGKFGYKLHDLKVQMSTRGFTFLKPEFKPNLRINFFLDKITLSNQNLEVEEIIKDEEHFQNIDNFIELDKLTTTSIIDDDFFFNNYLKDEISGKDYKEVVDQHPRQWIMNSYLSNDDNNEQRNSLTLDDALKRFDEEYEERTSIKDKLKKSEILNIQKSVNSIDLESIFGQTILTNDLSNLSENERTSMHKTKIYKPYSKFKKSIISCGNKINASQIKPEELNTNIKKSFYFNKNKYYEIKEKLGIMINDEIFKNNEKEAYILKKSVLNDMMANPEDKKIGKNNLKSSQIIIKDLKGEVKISEKGQSPIELNEFKLAQTNWIKFRKGIEKINGVYLLQLIGSVIKVTHILKNEINIPLKEKKELYKILEENEIIVNFLSNNFPEKEEVQLFDSVLIPDEHPEQITSLPKLQNDLENIKELLEHKKLKEEDRKKLEQLRDLYLKQKNILIENKSKTNKSELIEKNNIDVNKYIKDEEEKRRKAKEEEHQKFKEEIKKKTETKKDKKKKKKKFNKSIIVRKIATRIYNKQKMPEPLPTWTDDMFPPKKESLCPFNQEGWVFFKYLLEEDVEGWENYDWCRIDEIENYDNYEVFVEGATIDDIKQGDINDCYFLSAIGSLCNYPDFFDKLFHIKEKSEEHAYGIYLYLNGKWKLVLIDDYFPYVVKDCVFKELSFSCSVQNEIWVSLVEKAWAKVNGCYAKIGCGGFSYEAFDVLTEAYTEQVNITEYKREKKEEDLWAKIVDSFSKKYVITAGTPCAKALYQYGLCPGHAYTIINVYKVNTCFGEERLVKLKNPWGNTEFNGEWSDYSDRWTPEIKAQCEYPEEENDDDGIFYMSFEDFIKCFSNMDIAKLESGYQTTYIKIKKKHAIKCQVIRLIIKENNPRTFIQLYQKNPRIMRKKRKYYPEPVMGFLILVDSEFRYIKSVCGNDMHMAIEVDLVPGTYYIFCDVNYRNEIEKNKNYGYTVTFYSKNIIRNFENVTERIDAISALEVSMYYYCRQNLEEFNDESGIKIFDSQYCNKEIPFRIFCFINITKNPFKVNLDIRSGKKSYCIYNDRIASEFDTSVIKPILPENATTILIMNYSKKNKYGVDYEILPNDDLRTYENTHYVFNEKGVELDDKGYLLSHYTNVKECEGYDKGYAIGLENKSKQEFKLQLILDGIYDIDSKYKGKENIEFKILPESKKVFNVRFKPKTTDASFDFKQIK